MPTIDPTEQTNDENYRTMISATTPRPIGWISSVSTDGITNLAPFSHFNNVCAATPVIMFSVGTLNREGLKDTAQNVFDTEEFVVNVVTEPLSEQMNRTADSIPTGESEFDYADVEPAESHVVSPPRVADSMVSLECTLYDSQRVYTNDMFLGEVELIHISEDAMTDGRVDTEKIDSVGRLGGPFYTQLDRMSLTRSYKQKDIEQATDEEV